MKRIGLLLLAALIAAAPALALEEYPPEDWADVLRAQALPLQTRLETGARGEDVRLLQQSLIALGLLEGRADGVFGAKTAEAVGRYKQALMEMSRADLYVDDLAPGDAVSYALWAMLTEGPLDTGGWTLREGDRGEAVLILQTRLRALGYPAEADGFFGADTAYGVELFRYFSGMGKENGEADAALRAALFAPGASPARYKRLAQGSSGSEVRALQARLRLTGFLMDSADGGYGAKTAEAVRRLQDCLAERGELLESDGRADPYLQEIFFERFALAPRELGEGDNGAEVARLQRRLTLLGFGAGSGDGSFGAATAAALRRFQKRNGLGATGAADTATQELLYSEKAKSELKGYLLKVSLRDQKVYAYALDEDYEYTILTRTMTCSTGVPGNATPKGTFRNTGPGLRWHYFKKYKCWAQYAYYIQGNIMFHSVLYTDKNTDTLIWGSVYKLGSPASHGCVRLAVEDAKWIYQNCAKGTTVVVY